MVILWRVANVVWGGASCLASAFFALANVAYLIDDPGDGGWTYAAASAVGLGALSIDAVLIGSRGISGTGWLLTGARRLVLLSACSPWPPRTTG